ncbi:murein biosynthesis integral membrane protein MurJ [Rhizobiales bacterium TNE-4]|nr:murein biosynthesis integral membrane protein MurJ [Rhizobiales bacterium TNE-4]MBV1828400.1 murein biosynthesis integral membrane protein MurJ [Rhizobiales bacterium TNE-4]
MLDTRNEPKTFRNTAVVAFAGGVSRVTGFVRDIMLAALLGAGPAADAFVIAFRIPYLARKILSEGALHGALVPVGVDLKTRDGDLAARRFAGESLASMALLLLLLSAVVTLFAPALIFAMAPGFTPGGATAELATLCLRLSFPLVAGAVLGAMGAAFLAAEGRFGIASWSPVAVNAAMIAVLYYVSAWATITPERAALWVAAASSLGGLIQMAIVAWALYRSHHAPLLTWPRFGPSVRRFFALAGPGLIIAASSQFILIVALQFASGLPGAVPQLHYADRVAQLPLGFVAASVAIVAMPNLAALAKAGQSLHDEIERGLHWSLLLACPAAIGLAVLARPIVDILFKHGAFTVGDADATIAALTGLAIFLPFAAMARVLSQPFFAQERTGPALFAVFTAAGVTAMAAFVLRADYGVAGIAVAAGLGTFAQALVLGVALHRAGWWQPDAASLLRLLRGLAAAALMGLLLWAALRWAAPFFATGVALLRRAMALFVFVVAGAGLFLLLALLTRAIRLSDLKRP